MIDVITLRSTVVTIRMEKDIPCKLKPKQSKGGHSHIRQNRFQVKNCRKRYRWASTRWRQKQICFTSSGNQKNDNNQFKNRKQNCQKIKLYGSLTTKELKKKHSFRMVGEVETESRGRRTCDKAPAG